MILLVNNVTVLQVLLNAIYIYSLTAARVFLPGPVYINVCSSYKCGCEELGPQGGHLSHYLFMICLITVDTEELN